MAEAGLNQAEMNRLCRENPGLYDQAIDHAFKSFNKTVKAARNSKGQFTGQPVAKHPVSSKPVKSVEEIKSTDYGRRDNDRLDDIVATVLGSLGPNMFVP